MVEAVARAGPPTGSSEVPSIRFPLFDGFRAVAALAIVLTHVSFDTGFSVRSSLGPLFARADVGVSIFFLISGFLLYRPFVTRRLAGKRPPATAAFLWRRALRIYPAYWVALTAVLLLTDQQIPGRRAVLLWYGLAHTYDRQAVLGPILQSWTLAAEVAFYAFLPLYALLQRRAVPDHASAERRYRAELMGVGVLVLIAWTWRLVTWKLNTRYYGLYNTWLPAWLDQFGLGMLLAVLSAERAQTRTRAPLGLDRARAATACWLMAAAVFVLVAYGLGVGHSSPVYTPRDDLVVHAGYALVALLVLLPGVFGSPREGLVRRFLGHRTVQMLGVISYGVYLWHELWLRVYRRWADAPVAAVGGSFPRTAVAVLTLSILTASASWLLLERCLLRLKHRFPRTLRRHA